MTDPRMHIDEGVRFQKLGMLDRALQQYAATLDSTIDPALTGEALCRQAHVYRAWCMWDQAVACARRAVEIARTAGIDQVQAEALNAEAIVLLELGRFDDAIVIFERVLALEIDDRMRGIAYQNLGSIAAQRADFGRAEQYYQSSYRSFSRAGYLWGEAVALTNIAAAAIDSGKIKPAEIIAGQAIRAAKKVGDLELVGIASLNAAESLAAQRQLDRAQELVSQALGYFQMEENDLRRAQCFRVLGDVRMLQQDREEARKLYAEALRLAERVGNQVEVSRLHDCLELAMAVD